MGSRAGRRPPGRPDAGQTTAATWTVSSGRRASPAGLRLSARTSDFKQTGAVGPWSGSSRAPPGGRSPEPRRAGRHLVERRPQREQIRARIQRLTAHLTAGSTRRLPARRCRTRSHIHMRWAGQGSVLRHDCQHLGMPSWVPTRRASTNGTRLRAPKGIGHHGQGRGRGSDGPPGSTGSVASPTGFVKMAERAVSAGGIVQAGC